MWRRSRATREFEEFAVAHGPRLLRAAEHLASDTDTAQDLLQNAFTKVFLSWGAASRGDQYAYARRVLINCHTDTWRRRRWREDSVAEPADLPNPARAPDPSDWVTDRDTLRRALALLGPRERQVVVLRYYEDMAEQDVADLLGISPGTVKSTASRALARLRNHPTQQKTGHQ